MRPHRPASSALILKVVNRSRYAWVVLVPSCRSAPATMRTSRALPACARVRRWTASHSPKRCSSLNCHASWVRLPKAKRSKPTSAVSVLSSNTAASTLRSRKTTPTPSPSSAHWKWSRQRNWRMPIASFRTLVSTISRYSMVVTDPTSPIKRAMPRSPKIGTPRL